MVGFDRERALSELRVPAGYRVEAAVAIGKPGDRAQLPEALQAREQRYPTGLPTPIPTAIPHADPEHVLADEDYLHGQVAILRRGKKNLAALRPPAP